MKKLIITLTILTLSTATMAGEKKNNPVATGTGTGLVAGCIVGAVGGVLGCAVGGAVGAGLGYAVGNNEAKEGK